MKRINVLSLFDGMSCGQIALNRAGIKYDKYFASEIDKFAIQVTQHNYPDTIQLGSVTEVDVSKLEPIDLLIGGSPCQSFSFAGKRNGMTTTCNEEIYTLDRYLELKSDGFQFEGESYLFWEYMRILTDIRKYNPDVLFLLENVEMGNKWERVLSEAIGIYGVHINSALVSAQNRKRIYWTNIRVREEGLFGELHSDIPQPEDRGILLKDILEDNVDEKYYLSEKMLDYFNSNSKRQKENGNGLRFSSFDDFNTKSKTITTKEGGRMESNFLCVAMRGRNPDNPSDRRTGSPTKQRLEPNLSGKTNCLTSVQKDNLVMQINPSLESGGKQPYQHNRVYDTEGISPCLSTDTRSPAIVVGCDYRSDEGIRYRDNGKSGTLQARARNDESCGQLVSIVIPEATSKGYVEIKPGECFDAENINSKTRRGRKMADKSNCLMAKETDFMHYSQNARIRRLTPVECERLQTVDDNYTSCVSDTQRYKMLGNGWTVDVIAHIFSYINE